MANQDSAPRWLSITGKALPHLDLPNGMPGLFSPLMPHGLCLLNVILGRCRNIKDFEFLNHLGEGSSYIPPHSPLSLCYRIFQANPPPQLTV